MSAGASIDLDRKGFAVVGCEAHAPSGGQGGSRRQGHAQSAGRVVARQDVAVVAECRSITGSSWIKPVARPRRRLEAHVEARVPSRCNNPPVAAVGLHPQIFVIARTECDRSNELAAEQEAPAL